MLTRIYPQQVSSFSSIIDYTVAESFGFKGKTELKCFNIIKQKLLAGVMQFWVCYKEEEIVFALLTSITEEADTERRLLTVYAIKAFEHAEMSDFRISYETIMEFAKSERVDVVRAFYLDERITELVKEISLSYKVKYYVEMEV